MGADGRSEPINFFVPTQRFGDLRRAEARLFRRGRGVAWLTRRPVKAKTAGSNPVDPATFKLEMAQKQPGKEDVHAKTQGQ